MNEEASEMSELVLFEVPAYADVETFTTRVASRWPGPTIRDDDVWYVAAQVRDDETDLAALMREVEACVFDLGLQAIRYCLDGRFYILEALSYEVAAHPHATMDAAPKRPAA